jgi:proteasome activator subunit 4
MFEKFTTSNIEGAFVVIGLLNLLMPTSPPPPENPKLQPAYYLPS